MRNRDSPLRSSRRDGNAVAYQTFHDKRSSYMGPGGTDPARASYYDSMRPLPDLSKPQANSFGDLHVKTKDL